MLNFLARLFGFKNAPSPQTFQGFRRIEVLVEAERLNLDAQGRKAGIANRPAAEAKTSSVLEKKILAMGDKALRENQADYESYYQSLLQDLRVDTPSQLLQKSEIGVKSNLAELTSFDSKYKSSLASRKEKRDQTKRELESFRAENGLQDRDAHYPDSKVLGIAVILVILVGETALNSTLLAKGNDFGLLGGASEALIFSIVNSLFLGSVIAFFYRLAHSNVKFKKSIGVFFTLLLVCFAVVFNLCIAHYRNELIGPSPELAATNAWTSFLSNPIDLGNVQSALLMVLGLLVVSIASADFFRMDDPYPGYGKLHRKFNAADDDLYSWHEHLMHDRLEDVYKEANGIIGSHLEEASKSLGVDSKIIQRITTLNHSFTEAQQKIISGANELLQIYRDANSASRDQAAPAYFSEEWKANYVHTTKPIPTAAQPHSAEDFSNGLRPLQDELSKTYKRAQRALNGYVSA